MHPGSCANCCFNGLQNQDVGLSVGYCVEHRAVLHESGSTTCARLFRRDLSLPEARKEQTLQKRQVPDQVVTLRDHEPAVNRGSADGDATLLESDRVGAVLVEYRRLDSTATSLNRLNEIETTRAEVARLGLTRTYVNWCMNDPGGKGWVSGFRFLWWTRASLSSSPTIAIGDLWSGTRLPLTEQEDLARWSVLMERLTFLSDMGHHASQAGSADRYAAGVARLKDLAEEASATLSEPSSAKLLSWIQRTGWRLVDRAFPRAHYEALREQHIVEDPSRSPPPTKARSGASKAAEPTRPLSPGRGRRSPHGSKA